VANGYSIEIEDRGLGVPRAALDTLNSRLAEPPEFDLVDSDQLGLFVVSRLAARQQIRVSLRTSAYGGTLAIVLIPPSLVVPADEAALLTASARVPRTAPATPAGTARGRGELPARVGQRRHAPASAVPAARGPVRAQAPAAALPGAGGGADGLPRRQPLASMAPQLRESRPDAPRGPLAGRSPDRARNLLSAIRTGWQTGLSEGDGGQGEGTGQGRAGA
jgi:hypothetical protein